MGRETSRGVNVALQATFESNNDIEKINGVIEWTVSQGKDTALALLSTKKPLDAVFEYVSEFYSRIGLAVERPDNFSKKALLKCLAQDRLFPSVSSLMNEIEKPTREAVSGIYEGVNKVTLIDFNG